jgi:hypothetical protein
MAITVAVQQPQTITVQQSQMLSSSGLTGRSSTPGALDSILCTGDYWMPAFAGMTSISGRNRPTRRADV